MVTEWEIWDFWVLNILKDSLEFIHAPQSR